MTFSNVKGCLTILRILLSRLWCEVFLHRHLHTCSKSLETTLHVAKRHRGRLVFKRDENEDYKCTACTMCEKACPNGTIKIASEMVTNPETGKKKKQLLDYEYDLGDCMFCELCVNACNFDAIEFTNDFENAVFDCSKLILHLDKEIYKGGSLPKLIEGGADWKVGTFNTKKK